MSFEEDEGNAETIERAPRNSAVQRQKAQIKLSDKGCTLPQV